MLIGQQKVMEVEMLQTDWRFSTVVLNQCFKQKLQMRTAHLNGESCNFTHSCFGGNI